MSDSIGPYFAHYDPSLNPSRVKSWLDYNFHPYNYDPSTLIQLTLDQWNKRLDNQYIVSNGQIVVAPEIVVTQASLIANAKTSLATIRYNHEIAGISFTLSGATSPSQVSTDRDSQSKLIAAFVLASHTPSLWQNGTMWKMADNSFVALTSDDIINMALAVQSYIAACFGYEQHLSAQLNATTTSAEIAAIDLTAGWPT